MPTVSQKPCCASQLVAHPPLLALNNVGIYSKPLIVNVRIGGDEPQWEVDHDEYESSMNVIGQIYIKDKICSDPYSIIGAFVLLKWG